MEVHLLTARNNKMVKIFLRDGPGHRLPCDGGRSKATGSAIIQDNRCPDFYYGTIDFSYFECSTHMAFAHWVCHVHVALA